MIIISKLRSNKVFLDHLVASIPAYQRVWDELCLVMLPLMLVNCQNRASNLVMVRSGNQIYESSIVELPESETPSGKVFLRTSKSTGSSVLKTSTTWMLRSYVFNANVLLIFVL